MDFGNERYVRLYVRDTVTWKRLGWDGQNALTQMLRKADRSGVIDLGGVEPWESLVVLCGAPEDAARRGMARCLELECIVHDGDRLVFPRYLDAQECAQSDAQRQRESRAKRGAISRHPPTPVTNRDHTPSQNVTESHDRSQHVTDGHSVPYRAVPSVPSQNSERELKPFASVNSAAPAREEQDLGQEGSRETDKRRGSDFMLQATVLSWQGFDHELALIGAKPERERQVALEAMRCDPWCQANIARCDPKHVLRRWNSYASGNKPTQLTKVDTSESQKWRSRVQQSTQVLEELRDRRSKLQRSAPNYLSDVYDLDKKITEETDRLERRKRELHALTG